MKVQSWLGISKRMSYISSNSSNSTGISTPTLSYSSSDANSSTNRFSVNDAESSAMLSAPFHVACYITTLKTPTPQIISCLAVNPKNNTLYAASNNVINVYDLTNNYSLIDSFTCGRSNSNSRSGLIKSIGFDGVDIYTAHQDCKVRVWQEQSNVDQCSGRHLLVSTLPTVKDRLRRCILPKNYVLVRRRSNKQIKKLWIQHLDTISGLALSNGLMYTVSWDKCLKVWRMSDLSCLESIKAHEDAINAIIASPNAGVVYSASADGEIKVWRTTCAPILLIASLEKRSININALALNNDETLLFSGGSDQTILVWEKKDSQQQYMSVPRWCLSGHTSAILCLSHVHSNDLLISGSSDATIRVWQKGNQLGGYGYCCVAMLEGHSKPIKSLAVLTNAETEDEGEGNNGGVSVFSGSIDGEIKVWQLIR